MSSRPAVAFRPEAERWYKAYAAMESAITDLRGLSRIASQVVFANVGEADVVDGNCSIPEQNTVNAMIVVNAVEKAADELEALFYAGWNDACP